MFRAEHPGTRKSPAGPKFPIWREQRLYLLSLENQGQTKTRRTGPGLGRCAILRHRHGSYSCDPWDCARIPALQAIISIETTSDVLRVDILHTKRPPHNRFDEATNRSSTKTLAGNPNEDLSSLPRLADNTNLGGCKP